MELRADAVIPFPRQVVFSAYRDDLSRIIEFLPNLRGVEVKSRKEDGPRIEMCSEWHGGGEIPAAARAVLSEALLSWTDYATWHGDEFACDWRIETHAFTEAVSCGGRNLFLEDGPNKTVLQIRGKMEIDAKKIRGVPSFLSGKVGRTLEDFLGGKIQPNLLETIKGLEKYLESRKG
jgi:hypothetical protein